MSAQVWNQARGTAELVRSAVVKDKHYRVMADADGKQKIVQLDQEGRVPKVPLTSPWLQCLQYMELGREPESESHFACVCTPYIFNKYACIFGLTGSVGGKAELNYLTKTYASPPPPKHPPLHAAMKCTQTVPRRAAGSVRPPPHANSRACAQVPRPQV